MQHARPDFERLARGVRKFKPPLAGPIGHPPTIALTPVADGRLGAYEDNAARTWALTAKAYALIVSRVRLSRHRQQRMTAGCLWTQPDRPPGRRLAQGRRRRQHHLHGRGPDLFPRRRSLQHYRTPGGIPLTAYRYNVVGDELTCSVVEGQTVQLPEQVADHISRHTDPTWPEGYWTPRGMSSFEYMRRIGPNHDGNSFGLIGADLIAFNAMLRIPVDMHNVPADEIFRPTFWERCGGDDFRACDKLGPVYR